MESEPGRSGPPGGSARERAQRWNEIGRHDLAERELRQALAADPEDAALHLELASTLKELGRLEPAEAEARVALRLATDEGFAPLVLLAAICFQRGRHSEAEGHVLAALRLHPEFAPGYVLYGHLMLATGRTEKAERLLEKALELDPGHDGAHAGLALLHAERKRHDAARHHSGQALALDPEGSANHLTGGLADLAGGRPFSARRRLREALRQDPDNAALREAFLSADRATRWTCLPAYWLGMAVARLPGHTITLWAVMMATLLVLRATGAPPALTLTIASTYLAIVIYSWLAGPLTSLWIKLVPPR